MTRRDISAGVEFRQGFATTALEDGATTGQVPALAADGQMEFAAAGGGTQPGAVTVHDLGTVNAVDLLDGPQVLVSPAIGDFTLLTVGMADFVALDGQLRLDAGSTDDLNSLGPIIDYAQAIQLNPGNLEFGVNGVWDQAGLGGSGGEHNILAISLGGNDWIAALHLMWTDIHLSVAVQAWQANHSFANGVCILASGLVFSSDGGGSSGGSEPNWTAGITPGVTNPGATVSDGAITWALEGQAPTQGTVHLYALRGNPA